MQQRNIKGLAIIILLLATWGNGAQMIAAEIFYASINYKVLGPPTYCTVVTNIDLPQSKVDEFVGISRDAVSSWTENLKSVEENVKDVWAMNHKSTSHSRAGCDIIIEYKPYDLAMQPASHDVVAGTFYTNGSITIYYLQPFKCTEDTLCYYDDVYRDKTSIYSTMLHEIGHSLGAGHYVSDDPIENEKWFSGEEPPPSIMIPTIPANIDEFTIKHSDVQKIRDIYGHRGFYAYSDKEIPLSRPFVIIDVSRDSIVLSKSGSNTLTISGQISKDVLLIGHPVIVSILKPDQTVEVLKISHTRSGYFEIPTVYNSESPLGLYTVSVSYLGVTDTNMDAYFEVINTEKNNELSFSESDIKNNIDMQETIIDSLKRQAEYLNKAIIKSSKSNNGKDKIFLTALDDSVGYKIESAQLQLETAKEKFTSDDYESAAVALKTLNADIESISNTLERINEVILSQHMERLDQARDAIKFQIAGLADRSEFTSTISTVIDADVDFKIIPNWVRTTSEWWALGDISDKEFIDFLEYIHQNNIIS
ncbi:MAG: hypothetical protein K8823_1134 [Cenarchaeum symbiont of Oopsacas minuta]|nr:hypothetical protein [Cenarchaeum symbiont of Oopsacas minuta]